MGGAEKVLSELIHIYPQADIFAIVDFFDDEKRKYIHGKKAKTSFIQSLPFAEKKYRSYFPLMPLAIEQLDLSGYDIIISNSHSVAKGVVVSPDQLNISYCHSPMRYAWDMQAEYLNESRLSCGVRSWIVRYVLHKMRLWDSVASNRVDSFIANSRYIKRRISKAYRRDSVVIHPPVDISGFSLVERKDDYFLTASRLVPYKKVELIVKSFASLPDQRLVVIGDGPMMGKIKACAAKNVEILGYQPDAVLKKYMQNAKAFVFAAKEDFGIVPVEAMACGTPVIAFGEGGALDTVRDGIGGLFFKKQDEESIRCAINMFIQEFNSSPRDIRRCVERFSIESFRDIFYNFIDTEYQNFISNKQNV
jgi:glycosyltransferase involved in cell wall biosynthesis